MSGKYQNDYKGKRKKNDKNEKEKKEPTHPQKKPIIKPKTEPKKEQEEHGTEYVRGELIDKVLSMIAEGKYKTVKIKVKKRKYVSQIIKDNEDTLSIICSGKKEQINIFRVLKQRTEGVRIVLSIELE